MVLVLLTYRYHFIQWWITANLSSTGFITGPRNHLWQPIHPSLIYPLPMTASGVPRVPAIKTFGLDSQSLWYCTASWYAQLRGFLTSQLSKWPQHSGQLQDTVHCKCDKLENRATRADWNFGAEAAVSMGQNLRSAVRRDIETWSPL